MMAAKSVLDVGKSAPCIVDRRSLDGNEDTERVMSWLIGVLAIPLYFVILFTLEQGSTRVIQGGKRTSNLSFH